MKKYMAPIGWLLAASISLAGSLIILPIFPWNGSQGLFGWFFGIGCGIFGLVSLPLSAMYLGAGLSRPIPGYLDNGQVVRLRGFYEEKSKAFVMVELNPGSIRFLSLEKMDYPDTTLAVGHWYRLLGKKFVSIPIGEKV